MTPNLEDRLHRVEMNMQSVLAEQGHQRGDITNLQDDARSDRKATLDQLTKLSMDILEIKTSGKVAGAVTKAFLVCIGAVLGYVIPYVLSK